TGWMAYYFHKKSRQELVVEDEVAAPIGRPGAAAREGQTLQGGPMGMPPSETKELGWDDVLNVDVIGLEVGYRLIPLVDKAQGGQLLGRIKGVRKKLSQELGFL